MWWRVVGPFLALALLGAIGVLTAALAGAAPAFVLGVGLFALAPWLTAVALTLAWPEMAEERDADS